MAKRYEMLYDPFLSASLQIDYVNCTCFRFLWMASKHSIIDHIIKKSAMILDVNEIGNVLTEEQQIQVVLGALPISWDTVKLTMM